jgi:hypothetical protein
MSNARTSTPGHGWHRCRAITARLVLLVGATIAAGLGAPEPVHAATRPLAPVLLSVSPRTGHSGERITVSGTGLFSKDGLIVATFGIRPAPTRCPTRQRCFVIVPSKLHGTFPLRIHTESGTSNALSFRIV